MKTLLPLVFASIVLFQEGSAKQELPGTLISALDGDLSSVASRITCDGENFYTSCSDCSTILGCIGPISDSRDCDTIAPGKPYCVNGACSAARSNSGDCSTSSFTCTGVGYFPDPFNCVIYHYCEKVLEPSSIYQCPPKYVYNPATHMCRQATKNADCVTVDCDVDELFVPYGSSKTYYAYCQYDGTDVADIYMFKCVDYAKFEGTGCVFVCPREGNFAHPDPRKYYQCYYSRSKLIFSEKQCPRGRIFDNTLKVCAVPSTTSDEI